MVGIGTAERGDGRNRSLKSGLCHGARQMSASRPSVTDAASYISVGFRSPCKQVSALSSAGSV